MAWTKIPAEHEPLLRAALPADRRIETLHMFGGFAAKVNGHMFAGTFARSVMLMLSEADRADALALPGAAPFDPMGNGAMRSDKVQMPESLMTNAAELKRWVKRSFDHAVTLPGKPGKSGKPGKPGKRTKPAATAKPKRKSPA
jgi:TfoX/Sxy family transcriptional regulator of competence genes